MQVEVTFFVPPNKKLVKLLSLIANALESHKDRDQWPEDLAPSSTKPDLLERLAQKLTEKQSQKFKKILKEHCLSETDVCRKYGTKRIADLTGGDALDIIVKDILPTLKHKPNRSTNQ